ncbi:MAG: hypothetical protein ACM34I_06080 [bacterium]
MTKKTIFILFVLVMVPVLLFVLIPSDKARIKKLIKKGSEAIELRDLDSVMECVSLNYRDEYGMGYLFVKESFKRVFQQYRTLEVEYENLSITVADKAARAEIDVRVVGTHSEHTQYIAGDFDTPVHVIFTMEKERLKWQIVRAEGITEHSLR